MIVYILSRIYNLILFSQSIATQITDYFLIVLVDRDSLKSFSYDGPEHCVILIELLTVGLSVCEDVFQTACLGIELVYRLEIMGDVVRYDESALRHPERKEYKKSKIDTELFLILLEQYIIFHRSISL